MNVSPEVGCGEYGSGDNALVRYGNVRRTGVGRGVTRPKQIGVALVVGLFTRRVALTSLALLFTYVMFGTASVCVFYALSALVIMATWRTSSWIGFDGLVAGYRRRRQRRQRRQQFALDLEQLQVGALTLVLVSAR